MTEEIITAETERPDEELNKSVDEDDAAADDTANAEREAISQAVLASAHEFEDLATVKLTGDLAGELTAVAAAPITNPLEIITNVPPPGSRYDLLRTQLAAEAKAGASAGRAKQELLTTLLGNDLVDGMTPIEARNSATTVLTHLIYAARGEPLPSLPISPAAGAVIDVGGKLASMSDSTFWNMFADAHDGTVADPDELRAQLAIMGMAHELQPLTSAFTWPTGDAVTLQVDELIAAATIDPDYVDLNELYCRAGTLTLNGVPIPRAVMTELVRMAVADLITTGRWEAVETRTPDAKAITDLLTPEPSTGDDADRRNIVRASARELLTQVLGTTAVAAAPDYVARQSETRASRGYLSEAIEFLKGRIKSTASAMPAGKKAAAQLEAAVQKSALLPALEAWSAAYRAGESDAVKLEPLLDGVMRASKALTLELDSRFPKLPAAGSAEGIVQSFKEVVRLPLAEVALEVADLLAVPPTQTSDPLAGPATTAEINTVRARARMAALRTVNGEGGPLKFIDTTVPKALQGDSWCTTLRNAAKSWGIAETRDATQVAKAATDLVTALGSAHNDLQKSWAPGTAFVGENTVDALAHAVGEKIRALAASDRQIKALTSQQLTALAAFELLTPDIADPVGYWRKTKSNVTGVPDAGLGLADALGTWAKAAGKPADTATLSAATYTVVDALVGNRLAIAGSSMADADKAILLRALDDLGAVVAARMGALKSA